MFTPGEMDLCTQATHVSLDKKGSNSKKERQQCIRRKKPSVMRVQVNAQASTCKSLALHVVHHEHVNTPANE